MIDLGIFYNNFIDLVSRISLFDIIDIALCAYLFYKIMIFIKDTRAEQVFKGLIALLIFTQLTEFLRLHTIHWLLVKTLEIGFILPIIIFQPELRAGLMHIGNVGFKKIISTNKNLDEELHNEAVEQIVDSLYKLAGERTGALIVMERENKLNDIVSTGTYINSAISMQLLVNLFVPNTPLHDGAVIIRDYRILAAACFLPLTQSKDLSKALGTRHRAGVGISEVSDCLTLIVSEETGEVSIAKSGKLYRNVPRERLVTILNKNLKVINEDKPNFLKKFFTKE